MGSILNLTAIWKWAREARVSGKMVFIGGLGESRMDSLGHGVCEDHGWLLVGWRFAACICKVSNKSPYSTRACSGSHLFAFRGPVSLRASCGQSHAYRLDLGRFPVATWSAIVQAPV